MIVAPSVDEPVVNAAKKLGFAAEVKQQADCDTGATEVVEELTLRVRSEHLSRLYLDEDSLIHQKIVPIVANADAFVKNLNLTLFDAAVSARVQLYDQRTSVD